MVEAVEDSRATAAPAKKKSLFNKSAWAKPAAQKEGIDFFSRADELWPERLAEEERKRHKKATKLERKRSTASAEKKPSSIPDSKRRRVSQNEVERHSSEGSPNEHDPEETSWTRRESTLSTPGSRKSNSSSHRKPQASPVPLSERYSRDLHAKSQPKKELASKGYIPLSDSENEAGREISSGAAGPINLEDDDEGEIVAIISKPAIQVEEDPNFSDEEFPELARQARERAKQKELERLKAGHSFHDTNHDTSGSNTPVYIFDDVFEDRPAVQKDLAVEILVTSVIEGTKPLRVRRKLSQGLKEVRLIWCDKQLISGHPIPDSIKESIFLTWKGLRLWDLATCKSLGLKIDGSGHIMSNGEGFDSQRRIHFEAWTQDLFDANQRQLKAKQDRGDSEDEPEVIEQAVEQKMKLVMKARGMEPLKIFAKPTTTFERLAGAFRNSRDIPEGKDIILLFDGEKLDPNSTVEHVELDDMDNIEVHLR